MHCMDPILICCCMYRRSDDRCCRFRLYRFRKGVESGERRKQQAESIIGSAEKQNVFMGMPKKRRRNLKNQPSLKL